MRAARFQQHRMAGITKRCHQRQYIFLQQRFPARDLDERTVESSNRLRDFAERLFFAFVKRVFGIAVGAAQIAESEPNEYTWPPRPAALALDGVIDFVNG